MPSARGASVIAAKFEITLDSLLTSFQSRIDFRSQLAPTQQEEHSDGWMANASLSLSLSCGDADYARIRA